MLKELIGVISLCGVSVSNANAYLLPSIKKVSAETIFKDGANDFTSIYSTSIFFEENETSKIMRLSVHAMPLEKTDHFNYFTSTNYYGYKEYYCTIPFKIAFSIAISDISRTKFETFDQVSFKPLETGTNYFYRAYHLPESYIGGYDFKTYISSGGLNLTFDNNKFTVALNTVVNCSTFNLRNINGTPVYTKYESNDVWTSSTFVESTIKYDCSKLSERALNAITKNFNNQNNLKYSYNCSLSEEYLARKQGYSEGKALAGIPTGLEWVKGAIKTIEGFLNLNFGFFTLGQLMGGFLVVAIVLFIFKWFR